ncbi:hypothetical protein L204_105650 [Cryptococcus depauperatus]|nr:hypothetical protein L204_02583 [Cryptococcus depauperatus CBS 7855]
MSSSKDTFDLRAEEDAARRLNVGRVQPSAALSGVNSRAKHSELIGKPYLRQKVENTSRNHGIKFDDESALYLSSAIESSLRSLINLSQSAQIHRTTASHLHTPPICLNGSTRGKPAKPMWSHSLRDNPNAVLEALNRRNRDAEQEFRKMRMDRLARDAENQKAKERQREREREAMQENQEEHPLVPVSPIGLPTAEISTPGTPSKPVFGAVKETPKGMSTPMTSTSKKKSSKKAARDVSAEVQHKMTNLTAMRSVGMGKKYGWMIGSQPAISSPLTGKKRKADGESKEETMKKSPLSQGNVANVPADRPSKKPRAVPVPARRMIAIATPPLPHSTSISSQSDKEPQKVSDDEALTLIDVAFALEHGGLGAAGGQGIGSVAGEVLQRLWARGGPYSDNKK